MLYLFFPLLILSSLLYGAAHETQYKNLLVDESCIGLLDLDAKDAVTNKTFGEIIDEKGCRQWMNQKNLFFSYKRYS